MWRTHKAYKLNLEKQTDENIIRSKEHATKLQEPTISFLQVNILILIHIVFPAYT